MTEVNLSNDDKKPFEKVSNAFQSCAEWLHKKKAFTPEMLSEPEPLALMNATHDVLAAELGNLSQRIPQQLTHALDENIYLFSGFKTYHQMNDCSRLLKGDDGGFKPFDKFLQDVLAVDAKYNRNYLYAEYNFAVSSTQMAVKWHEIEKDGDDYDLQYRTAGDEKVREEHQALDGTTLPPSDKFWNEYYPPNGWNCRCTAVQVRKGKYPQSDSDKACAEGEKATTQIGKNGANKAEMFRFNPGKANKVFPPKHPYFKAPESAKKAVVDAAEKQASKYTLDAKTVAEAEAEIAKKLGVQCSFKGFKKDDLPQIQDIYSSVAKHVMEYPELKPAIGFVGSLQGRRKIMYEKLLEEYKVTYKSFSDDMIERLAKKHASEYAPINKHTYAYSAPSRRFGLNGVAFNATWKGEAVKKQLEHDVSVKWHPVKCDTVKAVFDHELGHKIDEILGLRSDADFEKIFSGATSKGAEFVKDNLSQYAYNNPRKTGNYDPRAEFIAEAWSEYLNNPSPRDIAKSVGELIEKKYKDKFGKK